MQKKNNDCEKELRDVKEMLEDEKAQYRKMQAENIQLKKIQDE